MDRVERRLKMDIVLVILMICALISAFAFNQGTISALEWNPLGSFFQGYLGWDINKTTVFCVGGWLILFSIVFVIGRITGWSKGLWFDPAPTSYENQDYNTLTYEQRVALGEEQKAHVKAGVFIPTVVLLLIAFVIALCKMGA